jgi:hypothetical protein
MPMGNYLGIEAGVSHMATRESGGVGIDHLTVVPEGAKLEPAADEEPDEPSDVAAEDDIATN